LDFDRNAIEASFAMQYNIRLSNDDISLGEFLRLLSGIMPDTPLGRLVALRRETNTEVIKKFGAQERKLRADWLAFERAQGKGDVGYDAGSIKQLQSELAGMFGMGV